MAGNPALGGQAFGIDATSLIVSDPLGPKSELIIEPGDPFTIDCTVTFDGRLANWILGLVNNFDVNYSVNNGSGWVPIGTMNVATVGGQKTYSGTETRVTVSSGALASGVYSVMAEIDLGAPPVSAFTTDRVVVKIV